MSDEFIYRPVESRDVTSIFELGKAHFGSPTQYSWDWSTDKIETFVDPSFGTGIVCTKNNGLVGFALAQNKYSEQKPGVAWFTYIAVDPQYQNKGIGKTLSERLLQELRKKGVTEVITDIYEDNTTSLEFFGKRGFDIKERWFILARKI